MQTVITKSRKATALTAVSIISNVLLLGEAFPLQARSRSAVPRVSSDPRHAQVKESQVHPPFVSRHGRPSLYVPMTASDSGDNSDSSSESKDVMYPYRSQQSTDKFDQSHASDWEPMDFDDVDEFFSTIDYPELEDGYVETDDPEELLQILQEMIDSSDRGIRDVNGELKSDSSYFEEMDEETLLEILGLDEDEGEVISKSRREISPDQFAKWDRFISNQGSMQMNRGIGKGMLDLERALMEGVVPAEAGVGSGILPGDYGFDPLELSKTDYFKQVQNFILHLVPERKSRVAGEEANPEAGAAMPTMGFVGEEQRPPALILRDYREAEIRHGRLAMLAAVIWPVQEILDRIFIPESFGSMTVIYGGPTLPFFPLLMTFFMLNLGYLDIYSTEIKENESGDAFLPGECFWDPLSIMEGAPDRMKRNMQEREILNGRAAMMAVAAFIFEEAMTHKPIITIPGNELLFEPAYQVPFIQEWLDLQFGSISSSSIMVPGI